MGLTTMWISNVGITPECVQRFVAIPKLKDAQKTCWIFGVGHIVIKVLAVYNGMLIFAKYTLAKCDPVYNGDVGKYDQIFPYYVMDVARGIPGLPGLFIVGALSAALSSMSSCLNSLSGTVYEDFMKPYLPNVSEKHASTILKVLTFTLGKRYNLLPVQCYDLQSIHSIPVKLLAKRKTFSISHSTPQAASVSEWFSLSRSSAVFSASESLSVVSRPAHFWDSSPWEWSRSASIQRAPFGVQSYQQWLLV